MNQPNDSTLYRRVNLLHSLMVSSWLVLTLALAIVTILLWGNTRRMARQVDSLQAQVTELSRQVRGSARPVEAASPLPGKLPNRPPAPVATASDRDVDISPSSRPEQGGGRGEGPADNSYVAPIDALGGPDLNRPAGLAGEFYDLAHAVRSEDGRPLFYLVISPVTVRESLDNIAKVTPAEAARQNVPLDHRLTAAQMFLQTGKPADAHHWAEFISSQSPDNGRAWLIRGLASFALKRNKQAEEELTRSASLLKDVPQPHKGLAELHIAAGNREKAVAAYREVLRIAPADVETMSRLSDLLIDLKLVDEAIRQLQDLLKEDASRSGDRAKLAQFLVSQGQPDAALAVLDARPPGAADHIQMHLARGHAYRTRNDLPKAEAAFDAAVKMSPLSAEGWHFLGLTRLQQQKTDEAIEALNMAIADDSSHAESWLYLGVALANQGKIDLAIAKLQEALRLKAESPDTHYLMAVLLAQRKQPELALDSLQKAVAQDKTCLAKARTEKVFLSYPPESPLRKYLAGEQ